MPSGDVKKNVRPYKAGDRKPEQKQVVIPVDEFKKTAQALINEYNGTFEDAIKGFQEVFKEAREEHSEFSGAVEESESILDIIDSADDELVTLQSMQDTFNEVISQVSESFSISSIEFKDLIIQTTLDNMSERKMNNTGHEKMLSLQEYLDTFSGVVVKFYSKSASGKRKYIKEVEYKYEKRVDKNPSRSYAHEEVALWRYTWERLNALITSTSVKVGEMREFFSELSSFVELIKEYKKARGPAKDVAYDEIEQNQFYQSHVVDQPGGLPKKEKAPVYDLHEVRTAILVKALIEIVASKLSFADIFFGYYDEIGNSFEDIANNAKTVGSESVEEEEKLAIAAKMRRKAMDEDLEKETEFFPKPSKNIQDYRLTDSAEILMDTTSKVGALSAGQIHAILEKAYKFAGEDKIDSEHIARAIQGLRYYKSHDDSLEWRDLPSIKANKKARAK